MSEPVTPEPRRRSKNRRSWGEVITIIGSEANEIDPPPYAEVLLMQMKFRVRQGRPPLPEGYVAPPGVDVEALLKQVPWPPPTA